MTYKIPTVATGVSEFPHLVNGFFGKKMLKNFKSQLSMDSQAHRDELPTSIKLYAPILYSLHIYNIQKVYKE